MARKGRFASGRHGNAVCDRSGLIFPYREMVVERGTGLFVHVSEVDHDNWKTHPQLYPPRNLVDAIGLENARPERIEDNDAHDPFIEVNDSSPLLTDKGHELLVDRSPVRDPD
jgi:hypothetical protein